MATDPHKVFRDAVIEAQRILARPIEPHGPNCKTTISALRDVFDGPAVRSALSARGAPAKVTGSLNQLAAGLKTPSLPTNLGAR